ncbi:hypothetical protein PRUB_a4400 [Pseudoalteromonas rubra]|uniref:Uncharacterized protein n=1 Tax=Pseudoalteromonas rubra TaxID=43658 RepID=A0A8T0C8Y4_9GAMM|nr:hypothetical protein PRUB_a4400 [Pseudoalteromonas rubra]
MQATPFKMTELTFSIGSTSSIDTYSRIGLSKRALSAKIYCDNGNHHDLYYFSNKTRSHP